VGATYRPHWDLSLGELNLELLARKLRKVTFPILGQSKSVRAKSRVTLKGQLFFGCQNRVLLG
jgi:hypothetical protein